MVERFERLLPKATLLGTVELLEFLFLVVSEHHAGAVVLGVARHGLVLIGDDGYYYQYESRKQTMMRSVA